METFKIDNLGDLTQDPCHKGHSIPNEIKNWLKQNYDYKVIWESSASQLPEGAIGCLIPKTSIVINVEPFIWEFIKLVVSTWVLLITKDEKIIVSSALGIPIVDALNCMTNQIIKIDKNKGERCTYLAILKASHLKKIPLKFFPVKISKVIKKHEKLGKKCKEVTCEFYEKKCTVKNKEIKKIIMRLEKLNIISINDNQICLKI